MSSSTKSRAFRTQRESFFVAFIRAISFFMFYYAVRTVIFNAAYILLAAKYQSTDEAYKAYLENANLLSFAAGAIIIALLALFFALRRKSVARSFCIGRPSAIDISLCFVMGISLNFTTTLILSLLPSSLIESYGEATEGLAEGSLIWYILAAVIMAPVLEELIFRAMMITRFSTATGNTVAVILSAAVFGAVHGHIVWSTYAFLLGILLGAVFVRSRSITASIATHLGFNLVSLISRFTPADPNAAIYKVLSICQLASIALSLILIVIFIKRTAGSADKPTADAEGSV